MDLKPGFEMDEEYHIDDDIPVVEISSATGHGIDELKEVLWKMIREAKEKAQDEEE